MKGSLPAGFAVEGLAVLTDAELFPKTAASPKKTARFSQAISRLEDLHEGDYVVHRDLGIGVFRGITAMTVDGVTRDYISLEYKDHSLLHVPVERLGYLEKYVGDRDGDCSRRTGLAQVEARAERGRPRTRAGSHMTFWRQPRRGMPGKDSASSPVQNWRGPLWTALPTS